MNSGPGGGGGSSEPSGSPSGGNQADGGATASAGVDAVIARRLEDLSPAEQAAISMALVDVAHGPTAACFAACEACIACARPCGTPSWAEPASTGGPLEVWAVQVPEDGCDIADMFDDAIELSGGDGGAAAAESGGCDDTPAPASLGGEEEESWPVTGHEQKGRANSGGRVVPAEMDTGFEEEEDDIMPVVAAARGPAAVAGDSDAAMSTVMAETDSDGSVAVGAADVDALGGSPGRGMARTEVERRLFVPGVQGHCASSHCGDRPGGSHVLVGRCR